MVEVKELQKFFSKNQQQISIQKIILQIQTKVLSDIIISAIINFNDFIVSNFIDVLQKKIDEIAKRRGIVFLRKALQKAKIDEKNRILYFRQIR